MHDASDGVAAPERALRATHDLDALDICRREILPAELVTGCRIIGPDAIDEYEHVIGLGAAHAHLGLRSDEAGMTDGKARNRAKQFADMAYLPSFDVVARDYGNRATDVACRDRGTGAGYDNLIKRIAIGGCECG